MSNLTCNVSEIFYSLQGEAKFSGIPTVFVRLVGCPLRCTYCDSEYAFYGNNPQSFDAIVQEIAQYNCTHVCVTGGEPLAHTNCNSLIDMLITNGYSVSLETSGALSIAEVPKKCHIVMDIKTPSSNETHRNRLENISLLKPTDEVKFVIGSLEDFLWSKEMISTHKLTNVLFSPVYETLSERTLAQWILEHQLNVKFQMQLHKHLWGDIAGV